MTRRFSLSLLAILATLAVVLGACASTPPAAPALTDPKEILTSAVTSLKDVKTFELSSSFTGTVKVPNIGNFDLSTIKMAASVTSRTRRRSSTSTRRRSSARRSTPSPSATRPTEGRGMLAQMLGAGPTSTRRTSPDTVRRAVGQPGRIVKLVADIKAALDKLPTPPTKAADEKCGDAGLLPRDDEGDRRRPEGARPKRRRGRRGHQRRPLVTQERLPTRQARLRGRDAEMGTFGITLDLKYDVSVSVDAPPADQIAP